MWPVIITKKDPLPEAEARDGETGKLEKYFSEAPARAADDSRPERAGRGKLSTRSRAGQSPVGDG
jgi:hypothetical protein